METTVQSPTHGPSCPLCSPDKSVMARHLEHLISDHFELVSMAIKRMEEVYKRQASCEEKPLPIQAPPQPIQPPQQPQPRQQPAPQQQQPPQPQPRQQPAPLQPPPQPRPREQPLQPIPPQPAKAKEPQNSELPLKQVPIEQKEQDSNDTNNSTAKHMVLAQGGPPMGIQKKDPTEKAGFYVVTIGNKKSVVVPQTRGAGRCQVNQKSLVAKVDPKSEVLEPKPVQPISQPEVPKEKPKETKLTKDSNSSAMLKKQQTNILEMSKTPIFNPVVSIVRTEIVGVNSAKRKMSTDNSFKTAKVNRQSSETPEGKETKTLEEIDKKKQEKSSYGDFDILMESDNFEIFRRVLRALTMKETNKAITLDLDTFFLNHLIRACRWFGGAKTLLFSTEGKNPHHPLKLRVTETAQLTLSFLQNYSPIVLETEKHHAVSILRSICGTIMNESSPHFGHVMVLLRSSLIHCLVKHQDMFTSLILRDHTKEQAREVLNALVRLDLFFLEPSHNDFLLMALSIILQRDIFVYIIIRDPDVLLPGEITDIELEMHYKNEHPSLGNHVIYSAPKGLQDSEYNVHGPCCILHKHAGSKYCSILKKSEDVRIFRPFSKPFPC